MKTYNQFIIESFELTEAGAGSGVGRIIQGVQNTWTAAGRLNRQRRSLRQANLPSAPKPVNNSGPFRGYGNSITQGLTGAAKAYGGDPIGAGLDIAQGLVNTPQARRLAQRQGTRLASRLGSRLLTKAIPGLNIASAGYDAYQRYRKGDYLGSAMSAAEAIPVVGTGFALANIARDTQRQLSGDLDREDKAAANPAAATRQQLAKQKQYGATSGAGIRGIGGRTVISKPNEKGAAFISTGVGRQRRTAQLPSTMSLPGGRVGDLAFRGGKATYLARPSIEQQRQDPLSRFARATNLLGFADRERSRQVADVKRAEANTRAYYNRLGVPLSRQNQMPGLKPQARPATTQTTRPAAAPAVPASTPSQGIAQARERLRMRRG